MMNLLTSVQAAKILGTDRTTTRRAAAEGKVGGARQEARFGSINPPWVAAETAWREWWKNRRTVGRPRGPIKPQGVG